jgi:hypothetical protein
VNWARGLFRVWVIFTFIWVLGFAFDAYQSKPFHPEQYVAMTSDGTIRMVPTYGGDADALNELVTRGLRSRFEAEGFPELTFFAANSAALPVLVEHTRKIRAGKLAEFRTEKMWNFLYFALGLPLALLLFGSAIGWALGGFKKTSATKHR